MNTKQNKKAPNATSNAANSARDKNPQRIRKNSSNRTLEKASSKGNLTTNNKDLDDNKYDFNYLMKCVD